MKEIILIFITGLFLSACTAKQDDNMSSVDTTIVTTDSLVGIDSSKAVTTDYDDGTVSELNNWEADIRYPAFVKIIKDLNSSPNVETSIKAQFCWGDCCGSYKKLADRSSKSALYMFKTYCGEYGSGNDQYFFQNDTLSMVRNFHYGIEEWPTDSTPTVFYSEEAIFLFNADNVTIKERKKSFTDNSNFTLDGIAFKDTTASKEVVLKEKTEALREQLDLENSTDE